MPDCAPRRSLLIMFTAACAVVPVACGDRAGAPASVAVADSARGSRQDGDERSEWRAVRSGDSVRIDERARFGSDGVAERVFVYAGARLVRAEESRTQTVLAGDRSPEPLRTRLTADFDGDETRTALKQVGDSARQPLPYEIDNLRRIADALLLQANGALSRARNPSTPPQ